MKATPLNKISGMPKLSGALSGWQSQITLTKRSQVVTNGLISHVESTLNFLGVIQPLSPKQIALKPEGQRAWTWLQIHCINAQISAQSALRGPSAHYDQSAETWDQPQVYDQQPTRIQLNKASHITTNDQIIHNGKLYKIMAVLDYSQNGFVEFHAVADYQDAP